jgi:tetratricopeptide (TPR) repeat protein
MNKRNIVLSILCFFVAGSLFASDTKKAQAYFHYLNGASKENQRKYDEAIKEYKQALEFDPDSSEILSKLAYLYVQTNRMPEAVEDAQKAIQKNPANKEAYRMLGQIYLEKVYTKDPDKEDLQKAIEQFREVYRLDPEDDTNLLTLGQLYVQSNQPNEAVEMLAKYIEINPDSPSAVMSLSNAFQQLDKPEEALKVLNKFLETDPDNPYVTQVAADLYEKSGDFAKALDLQRKIYEADPSNPVPLRRYIQLLEKNRQYAEAAKVLQAQVDKEPDRSDWKAMLAKSLQKAGDQEKAENIMREVIAKEPTFDYQLALVQILEEGDKLDEARKNIEQMLEKINAGELVEENDRKGSLALLYSHLGYCAQQAKDYDRAIDSYRKARMYVDPSDAGRIDFYIALNLRSQKKYAEAIETLNGITKQNPNDTDAWELLSQVYEDQKDLQSSDRVITHLIETHPEDVNFQLLKAERLQQRQKHEDSLVFLKQIQPKFPNNDQLLFLMGAASERLKRVDDAEDYFKKAITANPQNANALNYLGYMLIDHGIRVEESLQYVKRALELDRENGAFLDSLGWGYFKLNQLDLAEDNLRMAMERLDDNAVVHDHLGDLYFKQGKFREAITHWEDALEKKSIEIDPAYIQKKIDDTKTRLR